MIWPQKLYHLEHFKLLIYPEPHQTLPTHNLCDFLVFALNDLSGPPFPPKLKVLSSLVSQSLTQIQNIPIEICYCIVSNTFLGPGTSANEQRKPTNNKQTNTYFHRPCMPLRGGRQWRVLGLGAGDSMLGQWEVSEGGLQAP